MPAKVACYKTLMPIENPNTATRMHLSVHLPSQTYLALASWAKAMGFERPELAIRSLVEKALGDMNAATPMTHTGSVITPRMREILCMLQTGSKTKSDMMKVSLMSLPHMQKLIAQARDKNWIVPLGHRYTGGAPATVWGLTIAGLALLEEDAKRQAATEERNEAFQRSQAADIKRHSKTAPTSKWELSAEMRAQPQGPYLTACLKAMAAANVPEEWVSHELAFADYSFNWQTKDVSGLGADATPEQLMAELVEHGWAYHASPEFTAYTAVGPDGASQLDKDRAEGAIKPPPEAP